eukprot:TRINITY_DN58400_c0_g1_i1.p1 TRINITY_DN58400_c0_g1~~TRINITY_DN58400_c0_g1_i1.p1  ORF type:complete len:483 (+),score=111.70 TRINITY_DN58400_c0_g1_i1:91-1539(+)
MHEDGHALQSVQSLNASGKWLLAEKKWERRWSVLQERSGCSVEVAILEDISDTDDNGLNMLWPASLTLSRWIESLAHEQDWMSQRPSVVELGAGCGLATLTAALVGARAVATERKVAMPRLEHNIRRNAELLKHVDICTKVLQWGHGAKKVPSADFVTASDVLYNAKLHDLFARTVASILSAGAESARAWIAHDDSSVPGGTRLRQRFFETVCPEHGLLVCKNMLAQKAVGDRWASKDIHLYELRSLNFQAQAECPGTPNAATSGCLADAVDPETVGLARWKAQVLPEAALAAAAEVVSEARSALPSRGTDSTVASPRSLSRGSAGQLASKVDASSKLLLSGGTAWASSPSPAKLGDAKRRELRKSATTSLLLAPRGGAGGRVLGGVVAAAVAAEAKALTPPLRAAAAEAAARSGQQRASDSASAGTVIEGTLPPRSCTAVTPWRQRKPNRHSVSALICGSGQAAAPARCEALVRSRSSSGL